MKALRKTVIFGALTLGLLAVLLTALALGLLTHTQRTAFAEPGVTIGIDMVTAGNSCPNDGLDPLAKGHNTTCTGTPNCDCSLGAVDTCKAVSAGTPVTFDTFVTGLNSDAQATDDILGFGYTFGEKDGKAVGAVAKTHLDGLINLMAQPGSGPPMDLSTGTFIPGFKATVADMGYGEWGPPSGVYTKGVLGRYVVQTTGLAPGIYALTLNTIGLGRDTVANPDYPGRPTGGGLTIDNVLDGNASPQYGLIAVDTPCPAAPPTADVGVTQVLVDKEPDDPATGVCGGTPPTDINVSEDEWICLQKTVSWVSGDTPVDVDVTKTGTAPVSPAGAEVSYHCEGTEDEISVDGVPQTIPCPLSTELFGSEIIVKELDVSVGDGSPFEPEEEWDVHCTNPSTHIFTFTNEIDLSAAGSTDTDPTNNIAVDTYQVNCWAEADVQITGWTVTSPPSEITAGLDRDITVHKTLYNDGPYEGTVSVGITPGQVEPGDCTAVFKSGPSTAPLPYHVSVGVDEVWTINCDASTIGTDVTFTFTNTIAVSTNHVTDPDTTPGSNQASVDLLVSVVEQPPTADVSVSQVLVDKEPDNPTGTCGGTPPTDINVSEDEWICLQKTVSNLSGDTPVDVDITKTGTAPVSPAGAEVSYHCDETEDEISVDGTPVTMPCVASTVLRGGEIVVKHLGVSVGAGSPYTPEEQWDVHCTNPSTHAFTFTNEVLLSNPDGTDTDPTNNIDVSTYQVNCWAEADVQITDWTVTSPPTEIRPGQDVDVTVHKVMYNDGPYGPVNVAITAGAVAPTHCTAIFKSGPTTAALPYHVSVPVDEVWTINCDRDLDDAIFTFNNSIAVSTLHVTDPDTTPGSNQASTPLTLDVKSVLGDVNCSGAWDVVDAGFIFQHVLGLRASGNQCPLPANQLYMPAADVNGDTIVNIVDAGFVFQCVVGIHNVFCP